jgi:DNA-binding NarL/FixJ family response regulator
MTHLGLRALVVENEACWQEILGELLMDSGLIVDTAYSLSEALLLIKTQQHRIAIVDLSLADNHSRNTDGLRMLEAIRNLDPGCQTVLLTGFATVELAVSAMTEYGAFMVLRKESFTRDEFCTLVQRALAAAPVPPVHSNLPTANEVPTVNQTPAPTAGQALVVEDDAGWQSLLAELLAEAGYQACLCHSFGEASGYLRRETFTLAVVDLSLTGNRPAVQLSVMLEDLTGYHLLQRTRDARLPTIVVSGITTPANIQRAYTEQGIFAYLEKQTFERNTFLRLVAETSLMPRPDAKIACLTGREREVFHWLTQGLTNKEIAHKLVITPNTVKRHLKAIFEKLEVSTRAAAVAKATEMKS